jgi:hypothetical protein
VRNEIGPIASPDKIQFAPGLPKTRSGKIMRRILRKIAEDDFGSLGDTSTLAEPAVVDDLIENRQNKKDVPGRVLCCFLNGSTPSRSGRVTFLRGAIKLAGELGKRRCLPHIVSVFNN